MLKKLFKEKKTLLSFEVFPPKKEGDFETVYDTLNELATLSPDFISVTYGAGGSKSKKTLEIASYIQNTLGITSLAHLTCIGFKESDLESLCGDLKTANISHVLALRGDRPQSMTDEEFESREFYYASEMIEYLKEQTTLTIGGGCYPEKHFEALSFEADLMNLKDKVDMGADFLITQLFFDNAHFYKFREKALAKGIQVPMCTGIMPITSAKQLGTTVSLSGSSVPKELADIIATYGDCPEDMRKAGIDYSIRQILDLKEHGVNGIHIYTMNKFKTASEIVAAIGK